MAGRLPQAWLDELRDRADIVQVVSRYVQLNPKGGRYWGLCPFHGEKTPSFSVNPQRQMYYCFGCHAGGSAITFVMEMEHLDFMEAVKLLAEQVHMEVPELTHSREDAESKSRKERLYEANRQCARFFHAQLWKKESAQILEYLHGRELSDSTIRVFGLGATPPQSDGATRAMRELGFTDDELVSAGISVRREGRVYDMFRQRAIFPIIDAQGRVLGFGGRALGDVKPKYLNTGDTLIFNKRLGVFAANLLKKQRGLKRVILTEGYMDVIALVQAGVPGVCATLGTALTLEQARLLKRYAPEIWVSYDGDAAGQHAILRALDIFEEEGVPARVLDFPGGMDPEDYDLFGFCVGIVDKVKMLDPANVVEGDVLIGLASSGLHSNGYSLARKVCMGDKGIDELSAPLDQLEGQSVIDALLTPTRMYVKPVRAVINQLPDAVHALAHITGGGITENLNRALNDKVDALVEVGTWKLPPIVRYACDKASLSVEEALKTFNMGLGLVLIVDPAQVDDVMAAIAEAGETPMVVGKIVPGTGIVRYQNEDALFA